MSDCTDEKMEKIKEKLSTLLFELITDIPESLYTPTDTADEKVTKLIRQAAICSQRHPFSTGRFYGHHNFDTRYRRHLANSGSARLRHCRNLW